MVIDELTSRNYVAFVAVKEYSDGKKRLFGRAATIIRDEPQPFEADGDTLKYSCYLTRISDKLGWPTDPICYHTTLAVNDVLDWALSHSDTVDSIIIFINESKVLKIITSNKSIWKPKSALAKECREKFLSMREKNEIYPKIRIFRKNRYALQYDLNFKLMELAECRAQIVIEEYINTLNSLK